METDTPRRLFDSLESGMLWFDDQLRIVDANHAAREVLGLQERAFGARIDDLGWAQSDEHGMPMADETRPVVRALNGSGEMTSGIVVVRTVDQGRRWLRVRAVPVASLGEGRGRGVVVSFTDFTHEHKAAVSLQQSEQLFRMFGDHSLDLMWIVDPRTRKLLYMNSAYERIWGRPAAPLYEDLAHWLDGVGPADRPMVAGAALHTNAAGMYETEYRVNRPDGRLVWIRGRGFPLFDPDGRMRYMAGFAEDITLERAHRVAQERLERIVATAPGAVHSYCLDSAGRGHFIFASPAIHDLLGVDATTLVERRIDLLALVHPDEREAVADSLRASADLGSAWLATFRVPHTPACERCIEAHSMPVREPDGGVIWHGFFIDVTERRRAEQEIRSLNIDLEQRVAARTSELEAKHREMEAFTYSVSHDLKAPLRGIDGYSRLLQSDHADKLDEEGRFFVSMIRKATTHMGDLIDDLLAYSRVERGRPKLGPLSPASVLASVLDGAQAEPTAGQVTLTRSVEAGLVVVGEHEGLVLALRNLLDNALKFTAGRPDRAIEVGVRRSAGHALFWVRDNGPGFDMRYHDRIFEIFQRLHRAEEYPGTGVGLAIVRKAVERMHGRVWAESVKGQGATFWIELPAVEQSPNL
ncbi:MAG: PAS domain-containing protein [Caulobacter sp.]|nr:PAS domain-containing protein [Vitreoscilla sp.]